MARYVRLGCRLFARTVGSGFVANTFVVRRHMDGPNFSDESRAFAAVPDVLNARAVVDVSALRHP